MNALSHLMREAARRIDRAVDTSMRGAEDFIRNTAWATGESAHRAERGQAAGADTVRRSLDTETTRTTPSSDRSTTPLHGLDRNNRYIEFDYEQVRVVPLRSPDGKPIGVSFSSRQNDLTRIQRWVRLRHTSGNREYYPRWAASEVATRKRYPLSIRASDSSPLPAPWYDPETKAEPIVLNAHADGNGYQISIENPETGKDDAVYVDGVVFARLAEKCRYFQRACRLHPDSPVLQVSCSPATPGGNAHKLFAEYLHGNGFDRDIWAATDIMSTYRDGRIGVMTSIDRDGSMITPFVVARAPQS